LLSVQHFKLHSACDQRKYDMLGSTRKTFVKDLKRLRQSVAKKDLDPLIIDQMWTRWHALLGLTTEYLRECRIKDLEADPEEANNSTLAAFSLGACRLRLCASCR
jgi:hypothetical protein